MGGHDGPEYARSSQCSGHDDYRYEHHQFPWIGRQHSFYGNGLFWKVHDLALGCDCLLVAGCNIPGYIRLSCPQSDFPDLNHANTRECCCYRHLDGCVTEPSSWNGSTDYNFRPCFYTDHDFSSILTASIFNSSQYPLSVHCQHLQICVRRNAIRRLLYRGLANERRAFDWLLIDHAVFFKVNELIISK